MMRDPEQTIGNLIDRRNTSFVGSVDEDGYPEVKAMLPPRKREGIRTFYFTSNTSSMRAAHYLSLIHIFCGQGEALTSLRYEMLVILREPHDRFQESSVKGNHVARQRRVRRFSRAQFAGGRCRSRWRGMRPGIDAFHAAPVARPSLAALSKNREHKFLNSRSKHAAV